MTNACLPSNRRFVHDLARVLRRSMLALCCLATSVAAQAANQLKSVELVSAGGNQATLKFTLSDTAPVPSVFTVDDPARLSIDLPDTELALNPRNQQIDQGPIQTITSAAAGGRTRVVVELNHMLPYDISRQGSTMVLHVGSNAATPSSGYASSANTSDSAPASSAYVAPTTGRSAADDQASDPGAVQNIDFRRSDKGAGRIDITLGSPGTSVNVSQSNGQIVADIPGASLPARLQRRLDVTDFATPVKTVDALPSAGGTHIVITPNAGADYQQLAYQTGNDFYIELQPLTAAQQQQQAQNSPKFTGKKISLSFQSVDIRSVLQIIADVANVNMVVSDSVSGNIALRLEDVPWDQALDIILKAKGLGMQRHDNVISVAPLAEIAAREQAEFVANQASDNLAPLSSEIIQINYAKAADIASLLQSNTATPQGVPGTTPPVLPGGNDSNSLLSARGRVTIDERTNSLLVTDTRENLDEIHRLIAKLDIPVRQVLIESRIVTANRNFVRDLGAQFNVNSATGGNEGRTYNNSDTNQVRNGGFATSLPAAPTTGIAGSLAASIITGHMNVGLLLSALETEDEGEVISAPRVITANSQAAKIEQGVQIPYLEAASSGAATVEFKNAVLSLQVTPQITPDNHVIMNLFVTQDTVGQQIAVQGGGSVPSINTRSLTTQVLVNDGDTVVLGGIYEQTNDNTTTRIPIIGELPLIGPLFRNTQKTRNKQELLIFITPSIIPDSLTRN